LTWHTVEVKNFERELVEEWWWNMMENTMQRNVGNIRYKIRENYMKLGGRQMETNEIDVWSSDESDDSIDDYGGDMESESWEGDEHAEMDASVGMNESNRSYEPDESDESDGE
jgi:hypothetical protein